jgi:predicted Zn-dependent protease
MQKVYQAKFYNGISSKAFTVNVSFGELDLIIFYVDENGIEQKINWLKNQTNEVQYSSTIISLRYGDSFPYQQLDVTDIEFINEYKNHFKISTYKRVAHTNKRTVLISVLIGFIGVLVLSYFFLLPFLADAFAQTFPKEYEIALGEKLYASVLEGEEINEEKTKNINLFFKQMKVEGDYPVKITVVDKKIANAFALPGGGIVVYDKILDDMDTYNELAALLAHEYSHVQLKHATRNIFRSLSGYLFVSFLFGDVSGITAVVLQNAEGLRSLKYGRALEHEADENGLKILQENKIDASGMALLFKALKKENDINVSEFLSSHPDIDSRIDFVNTFEKANNYTAINNDSMRYYFERLK